VGGNTIESVKEFVYLGSLLTWDNDWSKEIQRRIAKATGVMAQFKNIWNSKNIKIRTKLDIFRKCVMSAVLYACETGHLKRETKTDCLRFR
jgi:hypothetical protein